MEAALQHSVKNNGTSPHGKDSQRLFVLVWLFWVLILQVIGPTIVHDSIQTYIADPVFFRIREMLGKTPELSPKLKILALDDGTVNFLKKPEVGLKDLSLLLANIARQKPRVILLDKVFSITPESGESELDIELMRKIQGAPIYTGASIKPNKMKYRSLLDLTEEGYGASRWLKVGDNWGHVMQHFRDTPGYIYAYEKFFQGAFDGVGHIEFDRTRSVFPFMAYQNRYLLPHISLYAAETVAIGRELVINGQVVPLKENGALTVNHRPVVHFYEGKNHMRSMRYAIERARKGQEESWVKEGDAVVILFDFFTGSTNFIEGAPFGDLPGGLMISTMVDSAMENRWIKPMGSLAWLILVGTLLGTAIARYTGPMQYWAFLFVGSALWFAGVNYLFSYYSIMISWVLPLIGMLGGGMIQYIYNRLGSEWRAMELENQYLQERARRLEEEKAKVQFAERLNLGRAVQEILLPPHKEQTFGTFTLSMSYEPAQEMSGDWIYLWETGDELRLLLGDVVGKGPSAAIPVAVIIGILGECKGLEMSVHDSLVRVNRRLVELFGKQISSSCTAIALLKNGQLELFNAGSPGWFMRQGESTRYIPLRSSALGVAEDVQIVREEIHPEGQAVLFTFTDGYMEGSRAFKRLIQRVDLMPQEPLSIEALQVVLDEVGKDFRLEDDRSLLLINI